MKRILFLLFVLSSCASSNGIHNDDLVRRHTEMMQQDQRMKKKMQKIRKQCAPRNKRMKHKRNKRRVI